MFSWRCLLCVFLSFMPLSSTVEMVILYTILTESHIPEKYKIAMNMCLRTSV